MKNSLEDIVKENIMKRLPQLDGYNAEIQHKPLIELGLDSLEFIELLLELEEIFGISIDDEDLLPENFQTITDIAEYIRKKQFSE